MKISSSIILASIVGLTGCVSDYSYTSASGSTVGLNSVSPVAGSASPTDGSNTGSYPGVSAPTGELSPGMTPPEYEDLCSAMLAAQKPLASASMPANSPEDFNIGDSSQSIVLHDVGKVQAGDGTVSVDAVNLSSVNIGAGDAEINAEPVGDIHTGHGRILANLSSLDSLETDAGQAIVVERPTQGISNTIQSIHDSSGTTLVCGLNISDIKIGSGLVVVVGGNVGSVSAGCGTLIVIHGTVSDSSAIHAGNVVVIP